MSVYPLEYGENKVSLGFTFPDSIRGSWWYMTEMNNESSEQGNKNPSEILFAHTNTS